MMRMNTMFDHAPTSASAIAIRKFNRLNSVKMFSFNICAVLLEAEAGRAFFCPFAVRSST